VTSENPYEAPQADLTPAESSRARQPSAGWIGVKSAIYAGLLGTVMIGPLLGYRDPINFVTGAAVGAIAGLVGGLVAAMFDRRRPPAAL